MTERPGKLTRFRDAILSRERADLPWRRTTEPYAILVSEMMLQQTQVDRVVPKYLSFLDRFPTAASLAQAPFPEVLRLWQGLGYNRRARYLQDAAQFLVEHPRPSYEELLALRGVGPYVAAAVCVFAYNERRAALDVNVRRIFSRYFGAVDDGFIAQAVPEDSRDWHNALMDFGQAVCTKRSPSCDSCPLRASCHAVRNDTFSSEPSHAQPRFEGSVRWHRGRILKVLLRGRMRENLLWNALPSAYRNRERFSTALDGLRREGFIDDEKGVLALSDGKSHRLE